MTGRVIGIAGWKNSGKTTLAVGLIAELDMLLARLSPCDLVIVEGFKQGGHPKIEARRLAAQDRAPLPASANVVAIAADHAVADAPVPAFSSDAIGEIADFVEAIAGLR